MPEAGSLWLSQKLMGDLFDKVANTIGAHILSIYEEEELQEETTTEVFPVVQQEGNRKVKRDVKFYNLDVILSVGYRVSSKRGTAFRIWAGQVLKDYLVKGYSLNEKKLQDKTEQYDALKKAVSLITNVTAAQSLCSDEAAGLTLHPSVGNWNLPCRSHQAHLFQGKEEATDAGHPTRSACLLRNGRNQDKKTPPLNAHAKS